MGAVELLDGAPEEPPDLVPTGPDHRPGQWEHHSCVQTPGQPGDPPGTPELDHPHPAAGPQHPAHLFEGGDRVVDITEEIAEGDRVDAPFPEGEVVGDRPYPMLPGVAGEHLGTEVDGNHPMTPGFQGPTDRPGPGGDIEDQAPGWEIQPIDHEPPPPGVLTETEDGGPTLVVPGDVPEEPRRGRFRCFWGPG